MLLAAAPQPPPGPVIGIFHEETFGLVNCIVGVEGVETAIACANDNQGRGPGRRAAKAGVHEFTDPRWITVQAGLRRCPL